MTPERVKAVQDAQSLVKTMHGVVVQRQSDWMNAHRDLLKAQGEFSDAVNALAAMASETGGKDG